MTDMWGSSETQYFFSIGPDKVLDAAQLSGLLPTGRCFALNSYENRVYDLELEVGEQFTRRVVKFYRPGRWTHEQILEEHQFLFELENAEIPVITPILFEDGTSLKTVAGIHFCVFPKVGGRPPEEMTKEQTFRVGRLLARIHNIGASHGYSHRMAMTPEQFGLKNLDWLVKNNQIPLPYIRTYSELVIEICAKIKFKFDEIKAIRIHGDCHLGNLLWNEKGPFFLDFDDSCMGPPVQDFWLLLSDRGNDGQEKLEWLCDGYSEMREFDFKSLKIIEGLRALRFIHYTTWIARRWNDPAFPKTFPHFGTERYWQEMVADLEEQNRSIS